jgi:hypothetical protein
MAITKTQDYEALPAGATPGSSNTTANGSTIVTTTVVAGTGAGSVLGTTTAGEVIDGTASAKVTATGTAQAFDSMNSVAATTGGLSVKHRWSAAPVGASCNVQVMRNTGGRSLSVSLLANGKVKASTNSVDLYTTPSALTFPGVYRIAGAVDTGTAAGNDGKVLFAIYDDATGNLAGGMTAPVEFTGLANVGAGANLSADQVGKTDAGALTSAWSEIHDSWIVTDTYALPSATGNVPPVITAGTVVVMSSGSTATVTFDATDSGPISSFQTPVVVTTAATAPTVGAPTLAGIGTTHATASYPVSGLTPSDTTISTKAVDSSSAPSTVAAGARILYTSTTPLARAVTLVGCTMTSPGTGTPLAAWNAWLANPYNASTNPGGVQPPVFTTASPPATTATVTVDYQPLDGANVPPSFSQSWSLSDNSAAVTLSVDLRFSGVTKATRSATLNSTAVVVVGATTGVTDPENTGIGSGAVARSQPSVVGRFA